MTNLTVRGVTSLPLLTVFSLLVVPSSRLPAQAAGAGATQRAAAANQNEQDRWESTIKKFEDADKVTPPRRTPLSSSAPRASSDGICRTRFPSSGRWPSTADSAAHWLPTRRGM